MTQRNCDNCAKGHMSLCDDPGPCLYWEKWERRRCYNCRHHSFKYSCHGEVGRCVDADKWQPKRESTCPEYVRVTRNTSGHAWYRTKIGEVFQVLRENSIGGWTVDDGKKWISKDDCEPCPPPQERTCKTCRFHYPDSCPEGPPCWFGGVPHKWQPIPDTRCDTCALIMRSDPAPFADCDTCQSTYKRKFEPVYIRVNSRDELSELHRRLYESTTVSMHEMWLQVGDQLKAHGIE